MDFSNLIIYIGKEKLNPGKVYENIY